MGIGRVALTAAGIGGAVGSIAGLTADRGEVESPGRFDQNEALRGGVGTAALAGSTGLVASMFGGFGAARSTALVVGSLAGAAIGAYSLTS